LRIGEAKYSVVLRRKPFVALSIMQLSIFEIVVIAIDFDRESRRMTDEIGNELAHRHLPSKSQSVDVMRL
jgi:hypothetical protein